MEILLSPYTTPRSRAVPSRNKIDHERIGARIDSGEVFQHDGKMFKTIYHQPNKGARNNILKKIAEKDSHANLATAVVQINTTADDDQ
ncbi:hypothetical protein BGZ60DRAFT_400300 [Tricladium varicosporioides]|nr:hypothetical protein BGZ60DRAFT_400300 [Hymenoscyphus varicosporioides]